MFGNRRKWIIVTGDDRDHEDGFRREGMRRRMLNSGQFRSSSSGSRENEAYDEGYKRGYEHAWKDHERVMDAGEEAMRSDTRYGW